MNQKMEAQVPFFTFDMYRGVTGEEYKKVVSRPCYLRGFESPRVLPWLSPTVFANAQDFFYASEEGK